MAKYANAIRRLENACKAIKSDRHSKQNPCGLELGIENISIILFIVFPFKILHKNLGIFYKRYLNYVRHNTKHHDAKKDSIEIKACIGLDVQAALYKAIEKYPLYFNLLTDKISKYCICYC
jgi:hypothetical protein